MTIVWDESVPDCNYAIIIALLPSIYIDGKRTSKSFVPTYTNKLQLKQLQAKLINDAQV